ncbi:cobalamin-independent methionine synthase II family protein [Lactiplantibacillus pentosus]|uniref:cobalamin-independent methionine synthase II family protein n=1 Tax=Lactiplantibacillus pentosus TaxID=1589 RepID=UPI001ADDDDB4|nr:cobalamin-independent methionine synthase II family protein [Lactiplantibacillus pentosus]MBO9165768.1 cobalamin-independent methionine synthase II family protein [Lactiplantibacillus pentosus]MCT3309151.1 5-methyltetrahydropteroyltriglutamate--homocysteine methyltransferase [Lactiplantibacillus pentosus]
MTKTHFQLVGSLLRPASLLSYKNQIEHRDDIQYPFYDAFPGYQAAEAATVKKVIATEKAHGIDVLTDGEYTKSMWHLDFVWGFSGIRRFIADEGYNFRDHDGSDFETRKDIGIEITAPLSGKHHHFIDIYKQLKAQADDNDVKLTIWSPAHAFVEFGYIDKLYGPDQVYKTVDELHDGLVKAYKEFLTDYQAAGGQIIQFDDCLWEVFASDNQQNPFGAGNGSLQELADVAVNTNNELVDFGHQLGLKVWTHNCRGNYESRHFAEGSYNTIAKKFLHDQHYDRFFLEWDDDRAGDISALKVLEDRPNVEVVLGLLSSKTNTLDDEDRALRLLTQASQILDKDRLYLSHQCGFASCDSGNELTEAQQWAKIDQGQQIAAKFWD